jgi:peptidoglycan/LPS O-acetylase OafA/YrhL
MHNNFHFLRLFAAFLVFYGHGFILFGQPIASPLNHETGIYIFFAISGFLISMSWDRDPHVWRFFMKRALRIFPALMVCVLLTVLLLGPLMTSLPVSEYAQHPQTLSYLTNMALLIQFHLPGVFSNNPYPHAVNGSLWSLPVEFLMYIGVAVIGQLWAKRWLKWIAPFIWFAFMVLTLNWDTWIGQSWVVYGIDLKTAVATGIYFWAGASIYQLKLNRLFTIEVMSLALIVLLLISINPSLFHLFAFALIPLIVLTFGAAESRWLTWFNKADYSYGFYVYAFPVQQLVLAIWPEFSLPMYFMVSLLITLSLAVLSWHWIERPCLHLKPRKH